MILTATAQRAIEAYGGADRWAAAEAIEARVTLKGFLFRLKRRRPPAEMRLRCEIHRPWTRLEPIDSEGHTGILDGIGARLEGADGTTVATREDARSQLLRRPRPLAWDALDLTYFLGYAFWNYLALPALLLRDDIGWTEAEAGVLVPRFPAHLPTHHPERQRLEFDRETGLLLRYDFVPWFLSARGNAANVVLERATSQGIPYESKRRVTPSRVLGSRPFRRPVMVELRFSEWRMV